MHLVSSHSQRKVYLLMSTQVPWLKQDTWARVTDVTGKVLEKEAGQVIFLICCLISGKVGRSLCFHCFDFSEISQLGTRLESHGLNLFCLQWEAGVKTSGGNGWVCPDGYRQLNAAESTSVKFLYSSVCSDAPFMMCFSLCRSRVPYRGTDSLLLSAREKTEAGILLVLSQRLPCKTQL